MDDVVAAVAHQVVDPVEGTLGDGRARSGPIRNPVERGRQLAVVDARVDDVDAPHRRPGGGVECDVVAPADEPAGKLGHEGLRAAALRLPDRGDERGDDGQPHAGITLKATSRGGLTPSVANGTRRAALRRTSAAASG